VVIVNDPATKEKLKGTLSPTNPALNSMTEAPAATALCGKLKNSGYYKSKAATKLGDWFMFDLGLATQSLCLIACSLRLGTVVFGMIDHDETKKVLGVGEEHEVVALIPIGYPAKDSPAPKRREIKDFMHSRNL
jgi:nitroreductase